MKKSFKKVVAVLLAVMMVVCSFPLTVLAADNNKANINLRFGDISSSSTATKTYTVSRTNNSSKFIENSGLNSAELTYSNGKISGYGVGDYFTVSVLVENISKLSSAEVALKYSDSIVPAYIKTATSGTATLEYTETAAAVADFKPLEAVTAQSGNALYNTTSTVGETSYIDADNKVIHANFAVQTGADDIDVSSTKAVGTKCSLTNAAVLATFMFKIVSDDAITFSIDKSSDTFYLNTIANGGSTDEYKTYAPKVEGEDPELTFMGENEYVEPTTKSYTITFVDADGKTLSTGKYEEGTSIVAPQLPAVTHDDAKHYTYAWDKEIPATATADGTYTIVKTGADHTWNEGVVTKEPTTTDFGEKTYTCTLDGCGATKTEQLPKKEEAHTHTWGEWVYNNDAVYTSSSNYKDGTATRTCSECGETETKTIAGTGLLRANGASVELAASVVLNVNFNQSRASAFDETYCVINYLDQDYKLDKYSVSGANRVFAFSEIAPKYFDKNVVITMYGVKDGIVCKGHSVNYSIKTYLYNQLSKNPTKNKQKLLIETMYYGEADQIYNGLTDSLITADLTEEQKAIHTLDVPTYEKITSQTPNPDPENDIVTWRSGGLELSGAVYVKYTIELGGSYNIDDYTFHFVLDGVETQISHKTNPKLFEATSPKNAGNQAYIVTYDQMASHQYSKPISSYVTDSNGVQVSKTLIYSAESYATSSNYKNSPAVALLVDQMLRYGRANIAFRENPNA